MPSYYQIDSSRVTFREYLWETKNPIVLLIALVLKLLRVRMPSSTDEPNVDSTLECLYSGLPADIDARFSPIASELGGYGFIDPVYHFFEDHGTQTRICWATYRHQSGKYLARIYHRFWGRGQKKDRGIAVSLITEFTDGSFIVTSSGKPDLAAPGSVQVIWMTEAPLAELWARHEGRLNAAMAQRAVHLVGGHDETIYAIERLHILQRDFHLARRVFRVRNTEEQVNAAAFNTQVEQARIAGLEHPEVMAELVRLQEKKPKWSSAIWVLVFSGIGFVAAGAWTWDWKITIWLIPILLFHELGHWLAMRIFKYRNLRMFFIPFFGAAVTGQNWNVPGWKKALVSLAGPLPGIALGILLGVAGIVGGHQFLKQAALMLIFLNAFNLLPVLPLDGGHFLHATLFCRNRWLDIAFRGAAVAALLILSVFGMGRLMMGVGIMLAIGLPIAFKMAKITDQFRNAQLPPPMPGEDRIPTTTAQALIGAVKSELPAGANNTTVAQHTLNIFETLNARPPNVFATLGLLAVYGGSILASAVCVMFLIISKDGSVGEFFSAASRQPTLQVKCDTTDTWQGANIDDSLHRNLIVSSFENTDAAESTFANLKTKAPPTSAATLFGSSLLLSLPAEDEDGREHWFAYLQAKSTNTFVIVSNDAVTVTMQFLAPSATVATNIVQDLNLFLSSPSTGTLIPPWHPTAKTPEFEHFKDARRAWKEITAEMSSVWSDPEVTAFQVKSAAAVKRGARKEVQRLQEQQREIAKSLEEKKRTLLKAKYESTGFAELVNLQAQLSAVNYTNQAERIAITRQIGEKLGSVENQRGGAVFAFPNVHSTGLLVDAPWLTVPDPRSNLPLLVEWLCAQKCTAIKYTLHGYSGGDEWDEEE